MISLFVTLVFAVDKPPGPLSYKIAVGMNWIHGYAVYWIDLISIVEPIFIVD